MGEVWELKLYFPPPAGEKKKKKNASWVSLLYRALLYCCCCSTTHPGQVVLFVRVQPIRRFYRPPTLRLALALVNCLLELVRLCWSGHTRPMYEVVVLRFAMPCFQSSDFIPCSHAAGGRGHFVLKKSALSSFYTWYVGQQLQLSIGIKRRGRIQGYRQAEKSFPTSTSTRLRHLLRYVFSLLSMRFCSRSRINLLKLNALQMHAKTCTV